MPNLEKQQERSVSEAEKSAVVEVPSSDKDHDFDQGTLSDDQESGGDIHEQHEMQSDQNDYQLVRDRVRKQPKPSARYSDAEYLLYALCVAENIEYAEPANFKEAMASREREQWMDAMVEEIQSLMKNKTWVLVKRPTDQKPVSCKWKFKKKVEVGNKIRFKARLVARGFTQEEGIAYNEVFSPVVKHTSIKILLAVAVHRDWEIEHLDVKTTFLHGYLEETIYMSQPEGFIMHGSEDKVWLLKKSLYGLKQTSM